VIKTVLFDCWGTLLQAPNLLRRGSSVEYFHRSLTASGCAIDLDAFREAYIAEARRQNEEARTDFRELDYMGRIMTALESMGFSHARLDDLVDRAWVDYLAEWPRQSRFFEEAPALLESIRGRYKLGLVTNFAHGPTARRVFDKLGFDAFFGSLVVSDEIGYRKPNRLLFDRALGELGSTPDSTVMVGDTFDADVVGAKNVGMKAILIDDGDPVDRRPAPDAVARSIGEVGDILEDL